jgi:O-antigen biosynthesis protein
MGVHRVAIIFDDQARPDTTGVYCRRALEGMVELAHFRPDELAKIPTTGVDLYLCIDDSFQYCLPNSLRPCAWWAIDTHLNWDWYLKRAGAFDFVFTAQRDGAERLQEAGIACASWLPLACDPGVHRKHELEKQFDVCFVGHVFPGARAELLDLVQRRFRNSFVGQRFFEEMARTYSASRTVFNRSIRNDVNMRVFEALACGSLLVTNDLADNGQAELFRDGVHLATYRDGEELVDKIRFYLEREELREHVAAAGRAEVLARDTYRHRMEKLLGEVEKELAKTTIAAMPSVAKPRETTGGCGVRLPGEWFSAKVITEGLLALMPEVARKVLVIGLGAENVVEGLKRRQEGEFVGAETAEAVPEEHKDHRFEVIVLSRALECTNDPVELLRQLVGRLSPGGQIVACVGNLRHQATVRGLLEGHWEWDLAGTGGEETFGRAFRRGQRPAPSAGPASRRGTKETRKRGDKEKRKIPARSANEGRPAASFTRREIEKVFFRAGMAIREMRGMPGAGHAAWEQSGRPGEVSIGGLRVAGMPPEQAEEFYLAGYLIRAEAEPIQDHGLTSIIVVTHNQLDYTRRCLDSVRRFTDEPYEPVLIDNGSADGTAAYLESVVDATVILNDENKGFPAAANQGMKAAKGAQIVLLNNDCVVTTGWLKRLLRALDSDPKIGLAGPCSNFVSGEQQIPVTYDEDLVGLDGFAWDWGKANDGVRQDTDRLVGFCLMIRRELVDEIGLLDEQFGIGCFEDDDYSRRALEAGYRAVIARDAYVQHFGGRTFVGNGVDFAALMKRNEELYRKKWEALSPPVAEPSATTEASPTLLSASQATAARASKPRVLRQPFTVRVAPGGGLLLEKSQPLISLCMIARDNARTIGASLESIRPWVDEMIVVDTGSKDETPEIARRLGAQVEHFTWCDDFSAARNESMKYARGKWIFWMDSDDTIDETNGRKLREVAQRGADDSLLGYVMQVHCPGAGEDGTINMTVVDHVKLFRNLPQLRFERRIHEQILLPLRRAGGEAAFTDIFVTHSGYDHSPEGQKRKLERDLRLLHLELKERPDDPFTLFNLGMTYTDVGKYELAADYLWRSIEHSSVGETHLRKAYALLVHCEVEDGHPENAWETCRKGLRLFPRDAELRFRKGVVLHRLRRLPEAVEAFQDVLNSGEERHLASVDRALRGFKARQNLAITYEDLGEPRKAEGEWRKVVEEMRYYRPGWRGLGEALLKQNDVTRALAFADELVSDPRLRSEGRMLRGRALTMTGDVHAARREFERAVQDDGVGSDALQALCRFLFEYVDPEDAQEPLEELVHRDPLDAAAYHNLGTVYLKKGQHKEAVQAYRQSLRLRPQWAPTYVSLGHALRCAGDYPAAIEAWQQALRVAPDNAEAKAALAETQVDVR